MRIICLVAAWHRILHTRRVLSMLALSLARKPTTSSRISEGTWISLAPIRRSMAASLVFPQWVMRKTGVSRGSPSSSRSTASSKNARPGISDREAVLEYKWLHRRHNLPLLAHVRGRISAAASRCQEMPVHRCLAEEKVNAKLHLGCKCNCVSCALQCGGRHGGWHFPPAKIQLGRSRQ